MGKREAGEGEEEGKERKGNGRLPSDDLLNIRVIIFVQSSHCLVRTGKVLRIGMKMQMRREGWRGLEKAEMQTVMAVSTILEILSMAASTKDLTRIYVLQNWSISPSIFTKTNLFSGNNVKYFFILFFIFRKLKN